MLRHKLAVLVFIGLCAAQAAAETNPIIVRSSARFTVITPGLVRLEYSADGKFIDERSLFAVRRDARTSEFRARTDSAGLMLETSKMTLTYRPDGKPFSAANLEITLKPPTGAVRWTPGTPNTKNLGGTNRTLDGVAEEVPIEDGVLSRSGWYLHDDSRRTLLTDDWQHARPLDAGTDWYFFAYGTDYKSALKDLAAIGGRIPMPRKYALGSWYSRYWPYTSEEYREIVEEYDRRDFPLDVIVMDMDWHKDGWTGWSWNRKLLPDAEALLKWFHAKGLFVTLNLHPADGVGPHEDMYQTFMRDMGVDAAQHPDSVIPFDAANRKYMQTLFQDIHVPLEKEGVDFWWLDWQQTEMTRGNPGLKNLEWLNELYYQHTAEQGARGISFSRWGGWGDHRHPIHFSGDAGTRWPMLEFEVPFTTTAGNVGCFFWSHDIGGHMGGFFPETNCRWNQFGAVSAALRLHSTRDATMDKRPWIRDSIYTVSQRIAFHLRSELFPYIYSSAWRAVTEMVPLTSPLYIEHPENELAYQVPQEYLFGPALLAAPITAPGIGPKKVAAQQVWFPAGTWYNWFTGEQYTGSDAMVSVLADIDEFPLYAKAGVPLTLQRYTHRMATEPLKEVVVRVYPGAEGSDHAAMLYEDDGTTQNYEKGEHALTTIAYRRAGDHHTIMITPAEGRYDGQVKERSYVIELPETQAASKAVVNGREAQSAYDQRLRMNRIAIAAVPIDTEVIVELVAANADPSIARRLAAARRMSGVLGSNVPADVRLDDAMIRAMRKQLPAEKFDMAIAMINGVTLTFKNGAVTVIKSADSKVGARFEIGIEDENAQRTTSVMKRTFTLEPGQRVSLPIVEPQVEHLTGTTRRFVLLVYVLDGKKFTARQKISESASVIRQWNLIGPFPFDKRKGIADVVYGPEQKRVIDPAVDSATGMGGRSVHWHKGAAGVDDVVDLGNLYKTNDCVAYGLVYLRSAKRQNVKLLANSDDGIEMFVNGTKVHSHDVMRGVEASTDTVDARLEKGVNTLLVKISQGSGGWGFRIRAQAASPIESSTVFVKQ